MNDWVIFHHENDSNTAVEYDWARIDALIAKLVQLHAVEKNPTPTGALVGCIAELEHAISSALLHGVSIRAIGVRTNLSQSDVTRIRDTGRLYER
ncbi:hypothetical protein JOE62_002060 [Glutamicibacter nicotianae]|nr:hypothetical protein [Glutamicibacter nicotianae]